MRLLRNLILSTLLAVPTFVLGYIFVNVPISMDGFEYIPYVGQFLLFTSAGLPVLMGASTIFARAR